MKSMTCRDLGGPCDHQFTGENADVIINAQDKHLKELVKQGDTDHEPAREEMKNRWKHPKQSLTWYSDTKKAFADLPEQ